MSNLKRLSDYKEGEVIILPMKLGAIIGKIGSPAKKSTFILKDSLRLEIITPKNNNGKFQSALRSIAPFGVCGDKGEIDLEIKSDSFDFPIQPKKEIEAAYLAAISTIILPQ